MIFYKKAKRREKMTIHERIKNTRQNKLMSLSEFAKAVGVTSPAAAKWEENGTPRLNKLDKIAKVLGVSVEYLQHGTTTNTQNGNYTIGGHNINGNVSIGEINRYNTHLDNDCGKNINHITHDIKLKSMPLLDIDEAIQFILFPEENAEKIKNTTERIVAFVNIYHETIGIKVSDNNVKNISNNQIIIGNEAVIEPAVRPRNNEFVLVALNARHESRRGIFAQLKIDLASGQRYLLTDDTPAPIKMPVGAVICGVLIQTKCNHIDNAVVISRHENNYNVWETEERVESHEESL